MREWKKRLLWCLAGVMAVVVLLLAPWLVNRMQRAGHAVAVFAPASSIDQMVGDSERGTLRIGSWNVAHGRGTGSANWNGEDESERLLRLKNIADFIRDLDLDVVVLNEVDFDSSWSHRMNQAALVADEAGYAWRAEQRNIDAAGPMRRWCFGNVVLSQFPITDVRFLEYPARSGMEQTIAGAKHGMVCTIELPGGGLIHVIPVHLEHRDEATRIRTVRFLVEEMKAIRGLVILAGDFNSSLPDLPGAVPVDGQTALSILMDEGSFQAGPEGLNAGSAGFTFHASNPTIAIDWILAPAAWRYELFAVPVAELSDHRPVVAELVPP